MTTLFTIGQIAKLAGVSHDTIRLYERYGLIEEPRRTENGYRQYFLDTVEQLVFIQRAKHMGFTLKEIQELLSIHQTSKQSCGEVKKRTQQKLQQIDEKIHELKLLEKVLKSLANDCEKHKPDELCPIFTSLKPKRGVR